MGTMQCKLWHVGFFVASSYRAWQSFNGLVNTKNKWVWVQDVSWKLRKQKCLPKLWSWNPRWFLSAESFPPLIIWNISLKHLSETNKEKEIPLTEPLIEAEWKYIILRRFREKPEIQQHWKDFSLLPLRDVLLRKRMHSFGFCPNEGGGGTCPNFCFSQTLYIGSIWRWGGRGRPLAKFLGTLAIKKSGTSCPN